MIKNTSGIAECQAENHSTLCNNVGSIHAEVKRRSLFVSVACYPFTISHDLAKVQNKRCLCSYCEASREQEIEAAIGEDTQEDYEPTTQKFK